jgi:rhodanese-related sulfurtransferase
MIRVSTMFNKSQFEKSGVLIIGFTLGIIMTSVSLNPRINFLENALLEKNALVEAQNLTISSISEEISLFEQNLNEQGRCSLFYGDVTPEQALKLLKTQRPPALIDVRSESEYNESRISDARNIPLNDLLQSVEVLDEGEEFILYCKSGYRSRQALMMLGNKGFNRTYNLRGGIDAWKESNLPISQKCPCEEE